MSSFSLRNMLMLAGLVACISPASATTIFTDSTFNPVNYVPTSSYSGSVGSTITYHQCSTCGDPGSALEFDSAIAPNANSTDLKAVDIGVYNLTFAYNPATQGNLSAITASVDKNLGVSGESGTGFTSTFRPLIVQDGQTYLAAISGPTYNVPTPPGGTGYQAFSGDLTASSFLLYDFSTNTFGTSHPNFAGDEFFLGIGQITSLRPGANAFAQYDNLSYTLNTVPLPSSAPLFGAALVAVGAIGYGRKRKQAKTAA